ncbi:MAG: hypothetical protein U1F20_05095 [Lysobacterales bacterium]
MARSNASGERIPSSATARVAAGIVAPRAQGIAAHAKPPDMSFSTVRRRSTSMTVSPPGWPDSGAAFRYAQSIYFDMC